MKPRVGSHVSLSDYKHANRPLISSNFLFQEKRGPVPSLTNVLRSRGQALSFGLLSGSAVYHEYIMKFGCILGHSNSFVIQSFNMYKVFTSSKNKII